MLPHGARAAKSPAAGSPHRNIRATGYATREEAAAAAEKIGDLLNLEPVVVGAR
ncbi:hypothetical protein [Yanghanlia caeni]|uniref:SPOR domain-containing protein n=1 Tax=Yanghanlia caeni TaxID=3064283 RepID=A0ABU1D4Y6_9BURK|nr:hypothetical protein [Alcaligenaceae bacterium LG-2]